MGADSSAAAAASRARDSATGLGAIPLSDVLRASLGATLRSLTDCLDDWRESEPLEMVMLVDARRIALVMRFRREVFGVGEPDVESERLGPANSARLGAGEAMAASGRRAEVGGRWGLEDGLLDSGGDADDKSVYIRVAASCLAVFSRRAETRFGGHFPRDNDAIRLHRLACWGCAGHVSPSACPSRQCRAARSTKAATRISSHEHSCSLAKNNASWRT